MLIDIVEHRLSSRKLAWRPEAAATVVLVAGGYPGKVENGKQIFGLDEAERIQGVKVYHAGTRLEDGRVLHRRRPHFERDRARSHAGRGSGAGVLRRADDRIRRKRLPERYRKERIGKATMNPIVGIIMGSDSDLPVMQEAAKILKQFEIPYEIGVYSAHRSPHRTAEYVRTARERGLKVIIAGAGSSAHLAGVTAAETTLPVIGVPIDSSPLSGFDALLSTVQMPPGVPVATMGVGKSGATNAGIFAVQILALADEKLAGKLSEYKAQSGKGRCREKQKSTEQAV